ncbi:HTH-type transcriptional regulator YesS [compost metagenome]
MSILRFFAPPLPHYIVSGFVKVPVGFKHPNRTQIGVFDLLVVREGALWVGEEEEQWCVRAGEALILRPDKHHYATSKCLVNTEYFWLHFQTTGTWSEADNDGWLARMEKEGPEGSDVSSRPSFSLRNMHDQQVSPVECSSEQPPSRLEFERQPHSNFFLETFSIQLSQFVHLPHPTGLYEKLEKLVYMEQQLISSNKWQHQLVFQEILQDLSAAQSIGSDNAALQVAEKAATYLRIHYREDISYAKLGNVLSFHPAYITRCMNKIFGCTPLAYLIRYRLEQAKLLLLNTDLPIGRVCEEIGINQASYFSNCFVKLEGVTPREYRQRYRKSK